jgi:membrane-associated phospholipid phosphatase
MPDQMPEPPPLKVPATTVVPAGPFSRGVLTFDKAVDNAFKPLRAHPAVNRAFYIASELGNWSTIWHLTGVARAVINPDRTRATVRLSVALAAESILVNQGVKRLFKRARPVYVGDRPHNLRRPVTSSFPSGHASAAACAVVLLIDDQPVLAPVFLAMAAVVSASRVHVQVHHASDVVGGALIGAALGLAVRHVSPLR